MEILGAPSKEKAIGGNVNDSGDEKKSGIGKEIEKAIERKEVVDAERNYTSPWDKEVRMSFRLLPLTDESGEVFEITLACHDAIFY